MKIKKVHVEFVLPDGLRTETHISTRKIGYEEMVYKKQSALSAIARRYKINKNREFFMQVSCVGGTKYNFYNSGKK